MREEPQTAEQSAGTGWDEPVTAVKGVTDAFAAVLGKGLKIWTVGDLLAHYPRRYEDRTQFKRIVDVRHGDAVTIMGKVLGAENVPTRSRVTLTKVGVEDDGGVAYLVFFNQWFVKKQFDKIRGQKIVVYGKASRMGRNLDLTEVEWEPFDEDKDALAANRIVPIYPLTEGVSQARLRRVAYAALEQFNTDDAAERLPADLLRRAHLPTLKDALWGIHFPVSDEQRIDGQRRLIFDEFFVLQLVLALRKRQVHKAPGIVFENTDAPVKELQAALPYAMTNAQDRVIAEIAIDMQSVKSMNRLVQGDVGAGKTVVAMAAIMIAVRNGYQAAMMAPTEILAEQHYLGIRRIMETLGVTVTLLSGSLPAKEKRAALAAAASGEANIVVGTHALIQDTVAFHKLGLAVVDEQHRFGVLQRAALKDKGTSPDILVMTATPIPRTLTLTVYGDLDVSIIDQLPPGRKPIKTHWKRGAERPMVYESLRALLAEGRQAYVICSLIEENEKLQARAATELANHLQAQVFQEYKVGLLHGQMKPSEKEETMTRFRDRELHILVSTTVIEVGVDVPNASVIIIEDAERFGMAQLHQLRGRVGRGSTQSYCLMIGDPKSEDGAARLATMARTTDGFLIAEEDLKLRGPGDFYGTRQSGIETLPFLDVLRDVPILNEARQEAFALLEEDPMLNRPEHAELKARVRKQYKRVMKLTSS
ncbi:ATP-dependent DNA helicase RecG [Capsulimonas corticalis]|uniref:ATP-dependent DNA helicase RecG n=1 Tax=Capsulimonas corticalis TaxID=2219043 RepID=A0A402CXQ3_9BACT|nr:ATP-dependent DNA helicase RecG [Capsulimonas corticalis]BDI32232.1 ATP-dependent DNA helicase RecG [Capsulimonas corticalis]